MAKKYDKWSAVAKGPTYTWSDGHQEWIMQGQLHRVGGPAMIKATGDKYWYQRGKLHRKDGPAVECSNGYKAWYIEGKKMTEEEFQKEGTA